MPVELYSLPLVHNELQEQAGNGVCPHLAVGSTCDIIADGQGQRHNFLFVVGRQRRRGEVWLQGAASHLGCLEQEPGRSGLAPFLIRADAGQLRS